MTICDITPSFIITEAMLIKSSRMFDIFELIIVAQIYQYFRFVSKVFLFTFSLKKIKHS